jgi:hypothetical protein
MKQKLRVVKWGQLVTVRCAWKTPETIELHVEEVDPRP